MEELEGDRTLRVTPERRQADDWALVLASAGIDSRIDWGPGGSALIVRSPDWVRASAALAAYDADTAPPSAPAPSALDDGRSYGPAVLAALLCAFFVITGPRERSYYWFDHGAAFASRIAAGQAWRTVTALTLHANLPHLVGNAATLIIFGTSLCGVVGTGVGLALMLCAGAAGNWLTAVLRGAPYSSVGASTAIFGAIGALAAIQLVRRRQGAPTAAWRAWTPIAAGLALLGFLGTSPEADVLAHLFGFAVGAGLGGLAVQRPTLRRQRGLQWALAIGAGGVVVGCWLLALRHS